MTMLTVRIDAALNEQLEEVSRRSGRSRSDVVREALRRQLFVEELRQLRSEVMPRAEARGYVTDEDVFADVS